MIQPQERSARGGKPKRGDSNPNRTIYNEWYLPAQFETAAKTRYDFRVRELRLRLLQEHCRGKDVLDLCCGSGSYLVPLTRDVRSIAGLDFSRNLLVAAAERLGPHMPSARVALIEGDATSLPFAGGFFDTVFSIASLYYVPNVERTIAETARVLKPGGVAILDFGNSRSLASLTGMLCHRFYGWARLYTIPYRQMIETVAAAGLTIEQHHVFQILPLFGPRLIQLLLPFSTSLFKYPLGITMRGQLLDSAISGAPLLRRFAFRHLLVLRKAAA
jgi:ubiquinone/menaquinone biosynthesis C-methylase UbiE